jgi:hypothetical protein
VCYSENTIGYCVNDLIANTVITTRNSRFHKENKFSQTREKEAEARTTRNVDIGLGMKLEEMWSFVSEEQNFLECKRIVECPEGN